MADSGKDEVQEAGESWRAGEGPRGFLWPRRRGQRSGLSRQALVSHSSFCHSQGQSTSEVLGGFGIHPPHSLRMFPFTVLAASPGDQVARRWGSGGNRKRAGIQSTLLPAALGIPHLGAPSPSVPVA